MMSISVQNGSLYVPNAAILCVSPVSCLRKAFIFICVLCSEAVIGKLQNYIYAPIDSSKTYLLGLIYYVNESLSYLLQLFCMFFSSLHMSRMCKANWVDKYTILCEFCMWFLNTTLKLTLLLLCPAIQESHTNTNQLCLNSLGKLTHYLLNISKYLGGFYFIKCFNINNFHHLC